MHKSYDTFPSKEVLYGGVYKIIPHVGARNAQSSNFEGENGCFHFNKHQSAYRLGHSTETALLLLLDNIFLAADSGKSTLLVSLHLSAAFDTIEHSTPEAHL